MSQGIRRHCAAIAAVLLGAGLSAPTLAFDRGQALYENHCQVCHSEQAHTRDRGIVGDMQTLRRVVAGWSLHAGLGWSQEDIDDVAGHLNRTYYGFVPERE